MESKWNTVIWKALKKLQSFEIDEIFSDCEKKLFLLEAPNREIELRLFALAQYCHKASPKAFFNSVSFSRFDAALDFLHFKRMAKTLIKENNFALIIYWFVLRCSFINSVPRKHYQGLEKEMREKALEFCR